MDYIENSIKEKEFKELVAKCKEYCDIQDVFNIVQFKFSVNELTREISIEYYKDNKDRTVVEVPEFVTDVTAAFMGAKYVNRVITGKKYKDMRYMFSKYTGKELDITGIDMSEVIDTSYMFSGCEARKIIMNKPGDELVFSDGMFSNCDAEVIYR